MSALYTEDSIKVQTQTGECRIDLCFGDITRLKKEDEVDVLFVSAFPGDYSATPTSLIGALQRNLGLSVRNLASDKEEDLRKLYCCWWSRKLPNQYPFKRILCFESNRTRLGHPAEFVSNVFRCMVPILNNQDGRVITPLLATGDQGHSKSVMLKSMVTAAVNWMKAGLPLRVLKIVLFTRLVTDSNTRPDLGKEFEGVLQLFSALKSRYQESEPVKEAMSLEFDVYISFSEKDTSVAQKIEDFLKKEKQDVRIFSEKQDLDENEVWQDNIYKIMIKCAKIIPVLSQHYLESARCTEQYNIALCVNRKTERQLLAPFYIEQIEFLPTYMGLVQYVNCSHHDFDKLMKASKQVVVALTLEVSMVSTKKTKKTWDDMKYDIFISYCHKNSQQVKKLRNKLSELDSNLKIFFDTDELKTGTAWQETLYQAIDGSRCMIACVSKDYLQSQVCQEEYNLALAKHLDKDSELQLIVVCLETLPDIAAEFATVKMVDGIGEKYSEVMEKTCPQIVKWLKGESCSDDPVFIKAQDDTYSNINIDQLSEEYRTALYKSKYDIKEKVTDTLSIPHDKESESEICDIAVSYARADAKYARFLMHILKRRAPSLILNDKVSEDHEQIVVLDTAKIIVPLVSIAYMESTSQHEELQIALSRHRKMKNSPIIFPILLNKLPIKPTYLHLIPYITCLEDRLWREIMSDTHNKHLLSVKDEWNASDTSISEEASVALFRASDTLLERIYHSDKNKELARSNTVIHNVVQMKNEILKMKNAEFVARAEKFLLDCKTDLPELKEETTSRSNSKSLQSSGEIPVDKSANAEDTGANNQQTSPENVEDTEANNQQTSSDDSLQRTSEANKKRKSAACALF
ncbi:uncharacterized protein [Ptychodera flava]|uniref:uncharacterized protein isoform X2 n=1 Tax=Ptychodera flava TaxID=63121 RepID=UPI00396A68CB